MKTIRRYMFFALLLLAAVACRPGAGAERGAAGLDYGRADMWYRGGTAASAENADVFYIAPTCNWGRTDADGTVHWQMDVYDTVQRANLQAPLRLAERVFAEGNRFYAPYYRQITMESWFEPDSVIGARFAVAMEDVREAFRYYLEHFNGGRRFVLAGHSQGARCVLELLKEEMNDSLYGRLVAAYVVGYRITDGELEGARYVVPAADSLDTGVVICINSVADTSALSPLFRGNRACINPMNWRTDALPSRPEENLGTLFLNPDGTVARQVEPVTARIDTASCTLIVDGLVPEEHFIPAIAPVAPLGNYHVQELNIYFGNLRHNVARRVRAYYEEGRAARFPTACRAAAVRE